MYLKFEELLKEKGITAYKVAKETNISSTTISDWKMGKYVPKIDKLQKIANYFGVSVSYFLDSDNQNKSA